MVDFAQTARCRTRFILEYFGEDVEGDWRCGNCDACDSLDRGRGGRRRRAAATRARR
jgi:ATP-dependent DNA helicase RecQ